MVRTDPAQQASGGLGVGLAFYILGVHPFCVCCVVFAMMTDTNQFIHYSDILRPALL